MRLSLDALQVLDAIDRKGSFAAAADELHRVPSAVTYSIQKLEQDLDVRLFDRSGHRAQLTEAGRELLNEGRALLTAAGALERRVKQVASGVEVTLTIAVDNIIPIERLFPLIKDFDRQGFGTRLRLLEESYGGSWDALVSGRADMVIGAPGDGPSGGGYASMSLGDVQFVFAVAPGHPLAQAAEPVASETLAQYRVISAADSSRQLPPRTSGLLTGQDRLTLPSLAAKRAAQVAGLGIGTLPWHLARPAVAAGELVVREVSEPPPRVPLSIAWRSAHRGKALRWWVRALEDETRRAELIQEQ